jgi:hypothetical protein
MHIYDRVVKLRETEGYEIVPAIKPPYDLLCQRRAVVYITPAGIKPFSKYKARDEGITAVLISGYNLPPSQRRVEIDPCTTSGGGEYTQRMREAMCSHRPIMPGSSEGHIPPSVLPPSGGGAGSGDPPIPTIIPID